MRGYDDCDGDDGDDDCDGNDDCDGDDGDECVQILGVWPITLIHLGAQCLVELFSISGLDTMKRPNDSHET